MDAKPSIDWDPYGRFWATSDGEDPEDEDSEDIPWEFDISCPVDISIKGAGVTTVREASMIEYQCQKEEMQKKVDEAAQCKWDIIK